MRCVQYREAISAQFDGEPAGATEAALDGHARACPACSAWRESASRATRLARLASVESVPDLTDRILASVASAAGGAAPGGSADAGSVPAGRLRIGRSARWSRAGVPLRVVLAVVGLGQAAVGWPAVVLGVDTMEAPMHVAHESGAWNVALAVAFFAVARRPRYAAGLLPLLTALVATLAVVTLPDLVAGHVPASRLATHLLLVVGLALVAALARGSGRPMVPPVRGTSSRSGDPVLDEHDEHDEPPAPVCRLPAVGGSSARGNAA